MKALLFPFLLLFTYCNLRSNNIKIIIEQVTVMDSVPSGSGILAAGDTLFIIGDDANSLYITTIDGYTRQNILFINNESSLYRISKQVKHDYEAVATCTIEDIPYMLAFGSGSLSPYRDTLLKINQRNLQDQELIPLISLYQKLAAIAGGQQYLNIEGAVMSSNYVFLMNRAKNQVYQFHLDEFLQYIRTRGNHDIQEIKVHHLHLKNEAGLTASISGGCMLNEHSILFTASLEDSPNTIDDGPVNGSYIGIIDLGDTLTVRSMELLKDNAGKVLKEKLESIDILDHIHLGVIKAIAIADNDDGTSKLFQLEIRY